MTKPSAGALLQACAKLEKVLAEEMRTSGKGLSEELVRRKEQALGEVKSLLGGGGGNWSRHEMEALSRVSQKLYAGALATARFSDIRARLGFGLAKMLGYKPPSVTYDKAGTKQSRSESGSRVDRKH